MPTLWEPLVTEAGVVEPNQLFIRGNAVFLAQLIALGPYLMAALWAAILAAFKLNPAAIVPETAK